MAYESKVTNKYFGTTFAGAGKASVEQTELGGLVNSLKNVAPQIEQLGTQYIKTKQDEAAVEINKLKAQGMSTESIKKVIDSGSNEILSNMYASATNNVWLGKLKAAEDINLAKQNLANYNPDEQTMDEFLSEFVQTDFTKVDKYYAGGYSSIFNEQKAKLLSVDAEERFKVASQKKTQSLGNFMLANDATDEEGVSIFAKLPQDGTYSNKQINDAALFAATTLYSTGKTVDDLDRAIEYLNADRGAGKNGQKLGSLLSANNKDATALKKKIEDRRMTLVQQNRQLRKYQEEDEVTNIFKKAMDMENLTAVEIDQLKEELQVYGNPTYVDNLIKIVNQTQSPNSDAASINQFRRRIAEGQFDSLEEMLEAVDKAGVPYNDSFRVLLRESETRKPIYERDSIYKAKTDEIVKATSEDLTGRRSTLKASDVRDFVENEIIDFYSSEEGRNATRDEKRAFMKEIKESVIDQFKLYGQTESQRKTDVETRREKAERKQREADEREALITKLTDKATGLTQDFDNTEAISKKPTFTDDDDKFLTSDAEDQRTFKLDKLYPYINNFVKDYFDNATREDMSQYWESLEQSGVQNFYNVLADILQVSSEDVQNALGDYK
jgi:hypothetical protein